MNFNTNLRQNEYNLNSELIAESINLYGVELTLIKVIKQNTDSTFGDFSHLKSGEVFKLYGLPENSESWDNLNSQFTQFGMVNTESVSVFVSSKSMLSIFGDLYNEGTGFGGIVGSLIQLPSTRLMEITNIVWEVPGINNVFTSNFQKSSLKLTMKTYDNKSITELDQSVVSNTPEMIGTFESLENYFTELVSDGSAVDTAATVTQQPIINKPLLDNTEDSVFGRF